MGQHQPISIGNGFYHLALGDVGSTNSECLERCRAGVTGSLWVTAERQLSGKGSRGRDWVSEPGNLYASLLLRDPGPLAKLHTLTFVASLAIRDAIYALPGAQFTDIALKWPNDVLLNGAKTSGILLESHDVDGIRHVIIGMGINIAHHPEGTTHPATHLAAAGMNVSPQELFSRLAGAMKSRLAQWSNGDGFTQIREDWLKAAAGIGSTINVALPGRNEKITGIFKGVDGEGCLILGGAEGKQERISVADIFFA